METTKSVKNFKSKNRTVVTIGTFDGVHIGHQKVLKKLTEACANIAAESVVLTFFPHPRMVLQQDLDIKLLNTIDEKIDLIANFGINHLIIHPFDKEFSRLTAEEFVKDILVDKLNICKIIIGYDHRFGRNRTATVTDLIEFGKKYDFEVDQITAKEIEEITISSTKIREALNEGDVDTANLFIGNEYSLFGKVIEGKKIGRTIGVPTANVEIAENYKLIPKDGVYIVKIKVDNSTYNGIMNIGNNPTLDADKKSLEVHILNFDQNIYGKNITISFLKRLRNEVKYDTLEDLKNQINVDKELAIEYFNNHAKAI